MDRDQILMRVYIVLLTHLYCFASRGFRFWTALSSRDTGAIPRWVDGVSPVLCSHGGADDELISDPADPSH